MSVVDLDFRSSDQPLGPIDDLTKYRIVEFLLGRSSSADAAYIAQSLGFHSVELTERALGDLVDAGICIELSEDSLGFYTLAPGALTRAEVRQLRASRFATGADPQLLRTLATRSLKRARDRAMTESRRQAPHLRPA